MINSHDLSEELSIRIADDIGVHNGELPERYALAWHGYIAGLFEWKLIDLQQYKRLVNLLPQITEPNPIETIFLGYSS